MRETPVTNYFNNKMKGALPLCCQIDLTYRCNYNCVHCYCKGAEFKEGELSTSEWIAIIDQMWESGCLWFNISGGEPLLREDFLEIYTYAKEKGFLITIFTNASLFNSKIIKVLKKKLPYSIEVTLNGIASATYEAITQSQDSFLKVINNLVEIENCGLPLVIKTNALQLNKGEILKIKQFSERLLGKGKFKFDSIVFQALKPLASGSRALSDTRLKPEEILELEKSDKDFLNSRQYQLCYGKTLKRDKHFLFQCKIWQDIFFINPYGKLKFCLLTDMYSQDLKRNSLSEAYEIMVRFVEKAAYKTNSKCLSCDFKINCALCPAKASLESGEEESSPEYFCALTKKRQENLIEKAIA